MNLKNINIGIAITGSFCTIHHTLEIIEELKIEGAIVRSIISENVSNFDTRFFKAEEIKSILKKLTGKEPIQTIVDAEPIGPTNMFDILAIIPCTGNTIGKIANGITDTTVTMAAKSHVRNNRPLVIGISTNDGLGCSGKNISEVMNYKNVYFVPYAQDNCVKKEKSLVFLREKVLDTIKYSLNGKQFQPVIN